MLGSNRPVSEALSLACLLFYNLQSVMIDPKSDSINSWFARKEIEETEEIENNAWFEQHSEAQNPLNASRFKFSTLSTRHGGDSDSTPVSSPAVHAESVMTLVNQSLQIIVANDDNYALAA